MQHEAAQVVRLLQFVTVLEKEEAKITETRQRWYESQRYTAQTKRKRTVATDKYN